MNYDVVVSDEAFNYLRNHRGSIEHLSGERAAWEAAYRDGIRKSYEGMRSHLPRACAHILDIGAGLGGVDILLSRHYDGTPTTTLLDGERDRPIMILHAQTHGNRDVARRFHAANGNTRFDYLSPGKLRPRRVDLIVSTGAWCFHFPPQAYLHFARECCHTGTVIILDVRKDKEGWLQDLSRAWTDAGTIYEGKKRIRKVYRAA